MAAKRSAAAKQSVSAPGPKALPKRSIGGLERTIHERIRLGVVSALAVNASLTFPELKQLLEVTDGNLSIHTRRLEEAGYIVCDKGFDGRVPRTEFRITAEGRRALDKYFDHMEALIRAARQG